MIALRFFIHKIKLYTMKKLHPLLIISIVAFMLHLSSSVSAQSLYTQNGSDPTWNYIMNNNLIPVGSTSTAGITGSTIDVNQNHPEITSSPYKDRAIQQNMAIHTLGNATVNRSNFYKWSRWYQEDENTQVFRLFKDEINVRNDVWYKPRIEAELTNHVTGSTVANGANWAEWSGTYTVINPVKSTIFQIWGNSSGAIPLMLHMENDGRIRYNPRQGGSGWKTMIQDATGKSFHIRVRDYGNKYEVYLNNALFETRTYNRGNVGGHFRWGLYHSGDAVAADFMMFVTGAQLKYSNDTNDTESPSVSFNTPNDDITLDVGYPDLYLLVDATDNVGVSNVELFIDDVPIRTESHSPYEWGHDGRTETLGLAEGIYTFKAIAKDAAGNSASASIQVTVGNPVLPVPGQIPGQIEAEGFDRQNGVEIGLGDTNNEPIVGYISNGDWMEYDVNVIEAGEYNLEYRYTSRIHGSNFDLLFNDVSVATINDDPTGDWVSYTTVSKTITIPSAGTQVMKLLSNGSGYNLNWFKFTKVNTDPELLTVCGVSASSQQSPNVAGNVLDDDLSTRWSSNGDGQTITFDLCGAYDVTSLNIAFYNGNARTTSFDIELSNDNVNWTPILTNTQSSGTTLDLETFDIAKTNASYVRYVGHGNSVNSWNSINEVEIYGIGTNTSRTNSNLTKPNTPTLQLANAGIQVYPNPTNGAFTINFADMQEPSIQIFDMTGRLQFEQKTTKSSLSIEQFNMFKSGMYLIRVIDKNQNVHQQKLIVE